MIVLDTTEQEQGDVEQQQQGRLLQKNFLVSSPLVTSLVEGKIVNQCGQSTHSRGSVVCFPMYNGERHVHPFGVCYLVRYDTMDSVVRNRGDRRRRSREDEENTNDDEDENDDDDEDEEMCEVCESYRTLNQDGTFDQSCVDRCKKIIRGAGQMRVYQALRRQQRPTTKKFIEKKKESKRKKDEKKRKKKKLYKEKEPHPPLPSSLEVAESEDVLQISGTSPKARGVHTLSKPSLAKKKRCRVQGKENSLEGEPEQNEKRNGEEKQLEKEDEAAAQQQSTSAGVAEENLLADTNRTAKRREEEKE